jgi:tetratricopeptide (TPR) repeat protein
VMGRTEEAMNEIRRAQELDPLSLIINVAVGYLAYLARRYDEALKECRKVLEMDSSFPPVHMALAVIYHQTGMRDEAVAEYEKIFDLDGDAETARAVRETFAASGYEAAMRAVVGRMLNRPGNLQPPLGFIAQTLARLGDNDQAIAYLEKACDQREREIMEFIVDPVFDGMHSDPRFQAVVRRLDLRS